MIFRTSAEEYFILPIANAWFLPKWKEVDDINEEKDEEEGEEEFWGEVIANHRGNTTRKACWRGNEERYEEEYEERGKYGEGGDYGCEVGICDEEEKFSTGWMSMGMLKRMMSMEREGVDREKCETKD